MISVLVTNIKGGCGKTTLATNLAAAFAVGGLRSALADADRQKSGLTWLKARPKEAARIRGLDWGKDEDAGNHAIDRLVIDAPAALRMRRVDVLIREADLVVIPVLPSIFDEGSTRRFLRKLESVKPVRKGRKPVAIVANRIRARSRATARLETFLESAGHEIAAHIPDRAIYPEVALQGLSIFDISGRRARDVCADWSPLLSWVESHGT